MHVPLYMAGVLELAKQLSGGHNKEGSPGGRSPSRNSFVEGARAVSRRASAVLVSMSGRSSEREDSRDKRDASQIAAELADELEQTPSTAEAAPESLVA